MGTVVVGSESYTIWGTLTAANTYLNGSGVYRSSWNAATQETKSAALVDATRYMEDLPWKSGITPSSETRAVEATYMLAGFFVAKPGGLGGPGGGSPTDGAVREVSDTTRKVSFFYSRASVDARTSPVDALPRDILAKIKSLLARGQHSTNAVPFVSGTDGESEFTEDKKFSLTD